MKEAFQSDLGTLGIVSSALFWCYAFGQLVSGRLGSYFGYKKLMVFGVISSAILNIAISFQQNLWVIAGDMGGRALVARKVKCKRI
jgi:sugar phosphate permease